MYKYPFRFEPAEGFCRATKRTYYSAEVDPGASQPLRWNSLQHL